MYLSIYNCNHVSRVTLLTGDDPRQATIVMVLSHCFPVACWAQCPGDTAHSDT